MNRFSKLVVLTLVSLLLVACRSTEGKSPVSQQTVTVGILQYMEHDSLTAARKGFEAELKKEGYTQGENLKIVYQNAQGDQANLQTISEQLLKKSDLVLAIATPAAQALATASTDIPIVFTAVTDPLSADLVKSLKKPGGLITGTSDQAPIAKQVALLKEVLPKAREVGILYTSSERNSEVQVKEAEKELKKAGYRVSKKGISSSNEVQDATNSLMHTADALFVPTDNTVASTMTMIGQLSVEHQVPVIGGSTDMVDAGGLLTYGTNYSQLGRQVARQAVTILKGQNPATIPVELPKKVNLHVNRQQAQKLGVDLSHLSLK
ncbi:ABC transporter substrate-binding protein [Streptococcus porcinus]|uniref:ABC transporter substrate binding protein n=2 Tax=Streptococcus porcinus TaxID=1340 RepID=A0A4V0H0J3_STRPO|nr:ABC transporter substrate-binding protein [Streptococcus porcinus]EGJ28029.1 ABC transporter substrate binding protein [Streptococcus porcinus str. Jelinkova 176]SQG42444.1 ABC transporter substrate binding protein [Streptococcus porcinus]VTT41496.1 ABC transporter substrate binding protein [Streptococcus porcinus]VTT42368.1 ABC transporter substrate binding protein [Streptococcus porcinus]